jgi:putative N6-adenine-specific DNA methylase
VEEFYKSIGDRLKQHWAGWQAWLISSNMEAWKRFGLRPSRKITLINGSLECYFQKFELYEGKKYAPAQME